MRQSGLLLALGGVLGVAFLATDPRVMPQWAARIGWSPNVVDAARESITGTVLGLAGAVSMLLIGTWLLVRKAI